LFAFAEHVLGVALLLLLVIHGLIHGMGFAKAYELAEFEGLTASISRGWGALWLVAGALLLAAASLRLFDSTWWWLPALSGVVVSQVLIIAFWSDAKFGSIPNLILFLIAIVGAGQWRFERMVLAEVKQLQGDLQRPEVVAEEDLAALPNSVRQWLRRSGVIGKPRVSLVRLKQRGRMRTKPGASWMSFEATQWISTKTPGFVWFADVSSYPGAFLYGRDKYQAGHGAMTISLLSLIPVVDATGPNIDKASMLRFLGEMPLYPSAALEPYVVWEEAGELAARATMTYGGITASGVFAFDAVGNVRNFQAKRYRETSTEDWLVEAKDAGETTRAGRRYPARWDVSWRLDTGDWTWLELEIFSVTYDDETTP
jgi:hypothetical protein